MNFAIKSFLKKLEDFFPQQPTQLEIRRILYDNFNNYVGYDYEDISRASFDIDYSSMYTDNSVRICAYIDYKKRKDYTASDRDTIIVMDVRSDDDDDVFEWLQEFLDLKNMLHRMYGQPIKAGAVSHPKSYMLLYAYWKVNSMLIGLQQTDYDSLTPASQEIIVLFPEHWEKISLPLPIVGKLDETDHG